MKSKNDVSSEDQEIAKQLIKLADSVKDGIETKQYRNIKEAKETILRLLLTAEAIKNGGSVSLTPPHLKDIFNVTYSVGIEKGRKEKGRMV